MTRFQVSVLSILVGMALGIAFVLCVMVSNMETVPEGKAWVLHEFKYPMWRTPEDAENLKVWLEGDRIYFEVLHDSRHLPPMTPPSGN